MTNSPEQTPVEQESFDAAKEGLTPEPKGGERSNILHWRGMLVGLSAVAGFVISDSLLPIQDTVTRKVAGGALGLGLSAIVSRMVGPES
jgi:hypothetical protein